MSTTTFQQRVEPWLMACFGEQIAADTIERNHRFLEEALELVQACGCTQSEAHQLVDYVFGRPVGEVQQEAGGVMVTLAALCRAQGISMHEAGETELARIWTKVETIRAKQAAKPKHSPLPGPAAALAQQAGQAPGEDERAEFEAWAIKEGYPTNFTLDAECGVEGGGVYADSRTHAAWWAYRAGRATQPQPKGTATNKGPHNGNDKEPRDPDSYTYLDARGDDEGQGLDSYWKWGHAAGWNDHKKHAAQAPAVGEAPAAPQAEQQADETSDRIDALMPPPDFVPQQGISTGTAPAMYYSRGVVREAIRAALAAQQAAPQAEQQAKPVGYMNAGQVFELGRGGTPYGYVYPEEGPGASIPVYAALAAQQAEREPLSQAAQDVLAERQRQISVEGWTPQHDDEHDHGELSKAASAYAWGATFPTILGAGNPPDSWPWDVEWWKPSEPRRMLVKAGALILAEIERLDRADHPPVQPMGEQS